VNCAAYIANAKAALGPKTTDRELGVELARFNRGIGFAQQTISQAKSGQMSDSVALAVGRLLAHHQVIQHAGEVLVVAMSERDSDPHVRRALADYAKGVVGEWRKRSAPQRNRALAAVA
jgi:hypothetical protein